MLITFEGIDGSGKSTQARLLRDYFSNNGYATMLVREPGGTELSERVRSLLLDRDLDVQPMAELLLFSAARAQLVAERLRPALETGKIVICDRFYDSSTAYQGAGRHVCDPAWMQSFHRRVTGGLTPDRTYLIELSPEEALARRTARHPEADRMETSDAAFYERVVQAYDQLAQEHPNRFLRVDGRQSIAAIHNAIRPDAERLLQAHQPERM